MPNKSARERNPAHNLESQAYLTSLERNIKEIDRGEHGIDHFKGCVERSIQKTHGLAGGELNLSFNIQMPAKRRRV